MILEPVPAPRLLLTILVVEDSLPVLDRLLGLIREEVPRVGLLGGASTGAAALEWFDRHLPDAVILDLHLPDTNGLTLLPEFKRRRPGCTVILLTNDRSPGMAARALALGAKCCYHKASQFGLVPAALREVRP